MPLLVTLHVFSGVSDPQWVISGADEQELGQLVAASSVSADSAREGVLGYRGFSIVDTAAEPPFHELFSRRAPSETPSLSIAGAPEVEQFLLWTGRNQISDEVSAYVHTALQSPPAPAAAEKRLRCPPCHAHDAPAYTPALWNHAPVQANNNCYNYANNQITNTFAQPGRATGHMYPWPPTCTGVGAGAHSDGLVACANFVAPLAAGHGWYVGLVIWPGNDYHWYRQDNKGCWSHKPGGTPARDTDNSGHAIADPRTCNRGPYTVFCTFMVTRRSVHIH